MVEEIKKLSELSILENHCTKREMIILRRTGLKNILEFIRGKDRHCGRLVNTYCFFDNT